MSGIKSILLVAQVFSSEAFQIYLIIEITMKF